MNHDPYLDGPRLGSSGCVRLAAAYAVVLAVLLAIAAWGARPVIGGLAVAMIPAALVWGLHETYRRSHQARHEFDDIDNRAAVARALGDER